ncbi:MAG: chemotaxis protein CheW [Sphingobium sp.]|nr:chemotaxis protein CheW [Sphingobium sp.]MBP6111246.1 chemotaxis protein CheW [Sphingobium sp.]MBP8670282.1 chemotaxis protein CheW [Sphingobium sp.]MBP9156220.1 chemotaxis protein CheW [Sphingobium sp.]MCC6482389.1 chemotaxis protein CheW [Sphingomonadaceae bacterium]
MNGLYLLAHVAGTAIAISTGEVDAVVRLHELSPVPSVPGHVAGLAALRSRVLTIIDVAALVRGATKPGAQIKRDHDAESHAIVCEIGGHGYGILVDRVDDIQTIESAPLPICGRIEPAWQTFAKGVVEVDGQAYFVVTLASFLESCLFAQAA